MVNKKHWSQSLPNWTLIIPYFRKTRERFDAMDLEKRKRLVVLSVIKTLIINRVSDASTIRMARKKRERRFRKRCGKKGRLHVGSIIDVECLDKDGSVISTVPLDSARIHGFLFLEKISILKPAPNQKG